MTEVETAEAPPVVCVGGDEFRAHVGPAWRLVQSGVVIRVTDRRSGAVLGWITRDAPPELRGRETLLPDEGTDSFGPEPTPEPPPGWVVRESVPA